MTGDRPDVPRAVGTGLRVLVADNPGPLTLDGTRTWIVGTSRPVILDPGPEAPERVERVVGAVRGRRAEAVCLTHAHPDHAGCAAEVAARLEVPLVASAETLRRLAAPAPLAVRTRAVADEDTVPVDGGESALEALETPGHSRDHLCWLWRPSRDLFTGDLVLGEGSSLIVHPDGEVGAYLASLARLIALRPARLLPGHGPPVADAVTRLEEYRRHRLERDRQVRGALAEGAASLDALRRAVYGDLPAGLERPAELSLLAHLARLRVEGEPLPDALRDALRASTAAAGIGSEEAGPDRRP